MRVDSVPVGNANAASERRSPSARAETLTLFGGSASRALAGRVAEGLGMRLGACLIDRFPDGEVHAQLEQSVRGHEVFLLQATSPPVNDHLLELLALADACRRAAAARIVALVPYFGYARSDRRNGRRTPIMAGLTAGLMQFAGIDEIIAVDLHTSAIEGFFHVPVDDLTAVSLLADAARERVAPNTIVIAPDLGALHRANRCAERLSLSVAVCHKRRTSSSDVSVTRITGEVRGRSCLIVDDMITTGGTVAAAARALRDAGAQPDPLAMATHPVLAAGAIARLADGGVRELIVTDSIPLPPRAPGDVQISIVSLAPLIAAAVRRLWEGGSLRELA